MLKGYDDDIMYEFSMALNPQKRASSTIEVSGLSITINPKHIRRVKTLPLGVQWRKEENFSSAFAKNNFLTDDEKPILDKN